MPHLPSTKKPTLLSIVIKSVDSDISENDIREELDNLNVTFHQIWKIKSRKTDKFTSLVRVTSPNMSIIDILLTWGITLFDRRNLACIPPNSNPIFEMLRTRPRSFKLPELPHLVYMPQPTRPQQMPPSRPKMQVRQPSGMVPKMSQIARICHLRRHPKLPRPNHRSSRGIRLPNRPHQRINPIDSSIVHPRQLIAIFRLHLN
ncbi:hypothetical protein Zmor_017654 [Zophobas morio]|uniref:Uncharacterized protein n=1 Tax=Zophobas morio TaxID=2755281 RepID=A0AA38I5N4_9CUCU|nr:hypothetical protein Zmor_017654 [Zophobas morio]